MASQKNQYNQNINASDAKKVDRVVNPLPIICRSINIYNLINLLRKLQNPPKYVISNKNK